MEKRNYQIYVDLSKDLWEVSEGRVLEFNFDEYFSLFTPIKGASKELMEMSLIQFDEKKTRKEVIDILDNCGLEPAKIQHLVAFAAQVPSFKSYIYAIGTIYSVELKDGSKMDCIPDLSCCHRCNGWGWVFGPTGIECSDYPEVTEFSSSILFLATKKEKNETVEGKPVEFTRQPRNVRGALKIRSRKSRG